MYHAIRIFLNELDKYLDVSIINMNVSHDYVYRAIFFGPILLRFSGRKRKGHTYTQRER